MHFFNCSELRGNMNVSALWSAERMCEEMITTLASKAGTAILEERKIRIPYIIQFMIIL